MSPPRMTEDDVRFARSANVRENRSPSTAHRSGEQSAAMNSSSPADASSRRKRQAAATSAGTARARANRRRVLGDTSIDIDQLHRASERRPGAIDSSEGRNFRD